MADIHIRIEGQAGRITLNRPEALNALSYDMALALETALDTWASDDRVKLVIIDAVGDKAFCAGGDIQILYDTAKAGDYAYGRRFWADEYRLNARIALYPKPYVAFMQGFTMGGGVGVSCHGSHRIVGETSIIAMPECGIGLIPDVGGSLILSRAPGRLGEYLGMTGSRMKAADAILAGFADHFIPQDAWPALIGALCASGDVAAIDEAARDPGAAPLQALQARIDAVFDAPDCATLLGRLGEDDWSVATRKALMRGCPLSVACTLEIVRRVRQGEGIGQALRQEYRFTARASSHGEFVEGIRAAIIDKDRNPRWRHDSPASVTADEMAIMLAPFEEITLDLPEGA